jgi:cation:H+ antiporter
MIVTIILMLLSVLIIWKSSDWLTDSLVPVANRLGTSFIAVTTLLVSFVLSLPEIFSSVYSSYLGHIDIGLGIIIGSVMANIGLIVGLSAIIKPLSVKKSVVIRDGIFLIIIAIIVYLFGFDFEYTRTEGIVLLLLFIPYALNVWFFEKWRPNKSRKEEVRRAANSLSLVGKSRIKLKPSLFTFFLSALILVTGSLLFSYALVRFNQEVALPGLLIGLVFGAIGTGIPNIAAALQGTLKGYKDAAITETFGSNIFTLLITLGLIIVISPFSISGRIFYFDLTWMIIMNLLLIAFIAKGFYYKEESLTRYEGVLLLSFYFVLLVIHAFW